MKNPIFMLSAATAFILQAATIDQVIVRQQWPWSTDVKVEYRVTGVTSPVDIQVAAYDGETALESTKLASSMKGDLFGIEKDNYYSFTIDPVKAFGKTDIAVMNFNVRLTTRESAANMTDVLYKVVDLNSGAVTDIRRADFYGGKYGSFTTNFSDFVINNVACQTDLEDVLIWTEVTNNPTYRTDFLVLRHIPAASWGVWPMDAPGGSSGTSQSGMAGTMHPVKLTRDYYAGVFPVTQAQYKKIVGTFGKSYTNEDEYVDHQFKPVSGLDWSLVNAAVSTLGALAGERLQFSLPTEAQWEFAARGGVTNNAIFSKVAAYGQGTLYAAAWSKVNNLKSQNTAVNAGYETVQTVAVGRLAPNAFGLYDVLGNVREFCKDFSSDTAYSWPEGIAVDPQGVEEKDAATTGSNNLPKYVMRGGSIEDAHTYCTLRSRFSAGRYTQNPYYGFRVICTAE